MNVLTIINLTTGSSSFVAAALPADAEHDIGGEELDHHLPGTDGHHITLLPRKETRLKMRKMKALKTSAGPIPQTMNCKFQLFERNRSIYRAF